MKHADFIIGGTFWCGGHQWRCTDIGTRTIVAIRTDRVLVANNAGDLQQLSGGDADSWLSGPPYAVAEVVFDENDLEGCTSTSSDDGTYARSS
jgi:hypothetical protein